MLGQPWTQRVEMRQAAWHPRHPDTYCQCDTYCPCHCDTYCHFVLECVYL